MKIHLPNVTLLGIDCVDAHRLQEAINICEVGMQFAQSKILTSLPLQDSRAVSIPHIGSIEEYSRFCIENLVDYVDTEYVLLVQYDGFILNPESWSEDFLKYDYIGAPWLVADWAVRDFAFPGNLLGTYMVGNGGFCMRSKKFLETSARLLKEGKLPKFHPEDVAMCVWYRDTFEKEGIHFAPAELAKKFSIEGDDDVYGNQFGFHGFAWTNIDAWIDEHKDFLLTYNGYKKKRLSKFHAGLISARENTLGKIKKTFENIAIEAHVVGSVARRDSDAYSDLDVWITCKNEDWEKCSENRYEYYSQIGKIIHVCEPPQNAPDNGIFSTVYFKKNDNIIIVDFYLCPESTSFITDESKTIFGNITLPLGKLGLNPQKKSVPETYRIDFFICFIFNTIKKIVRRDIDSFDGVLHQYENLHDKYNISVPPLRIQNKNFDELKMIIENIKPFSTKKQVDVLQEIESFIDLVMKNENV